MKQLFTRLSLPIPLNKSDRNLRECLTSNNFTITSEDILDIEFGLDFLRQNNITELPDNRIALVSHFRDNQSIGRKIMNTVTSLGYVYTGRIEQNIIFYNPIMMSPLSLSLIPLVYAIGANVAQTIFTSNSFAGVLVAYPLLAFSLISSTRGAFISSILNMPFRSFSELVGHEHIHILQKNRPVNADVFSHEYNVLDGDLADLTMSKLDSFGELISGIDSFIALQIPRYLRADAEVQARLHTIMVQNCKSWNQLPQDKPSLFLALDEAGVSIPRSMKIALDLLNKKSEYKNFKIKKTLTSLFNRQVRRISNPAVTEMNSIINGLIQEDAKITFWTETLPFLYGNWLEMIGDKDGLKKMGINKPIKQKQMSFDSQN